MKDENACQQIAVATPVGKALGSCIRQAGKLQT